MLAEDPAAEILPLAKATSRVRHRSEDAQSWLCVPNGPALAARARRLVSRGGKARTIAGALVLAATVFVLSTRAHLDTSRSNQSDVFEYRLGNPAVVEPGVLAFDSPEQPPERPTPLPLFHPSTTLAFSSSLECLDAFVSTTTLCDSMRTRSDPPMMISLVWTWTNGSDARVAAWRERAARDGVPDSSRVDDDEFGDGILRHFRDHDELRYSVRSALSAIPLANIASIHLVVGDTRTIRPSDPAESESRHLRYAEVPQWLPLDRIKAEGDHNSDLRPGPAFMVHPHSTVFNSSHNGRDRLPSFNSAGIESQLGFVPGTTPEVLYLNDDCFLSRNLSLLDIASPLTGPVFRMYRHFVVESAEPGQAKEDVEGEWHSLRTSNWLLDRRFGTRNRPYLFHVAKTLSFPMLREASDVWREEFEETASARFRGDRRLQVASTFLSTHFQLEKHREALLWSFIVAKSDLDHDGSLSSSERRAMLDYLKADSVYLEETRSVYAQTPNRTTLDRLARAHADAHLGAGPLGSTVEFSSFDGYPFFAIDNTLEPSVPKWSTWPTFATDGDSGSGAPCVIPLDTCFSRPFFDVGPNERHVTTSAVEVFRRVAFEHRACGDCLVVHLVAKSGPAGLEAFLPLRAATTVDDNDDDDDQLPVETIGGSGKRWEDVEYEAWTGGSASSIRRRAIYLIHRYTYSLATSAIEFKQIWAGGDDLSQTLAALSEPAPESGSDRRRAAFWAINDDLPVDRPDVVRDADDRFKRWIDGVWPDPSRFEAAAPSAP
ncbi:hypothetical protein JCM11491_003913 [Sporobolomyces phaffii]